MIIQTNTNGDGIPSFYCIEPQRAEELISHFESVTHKYANKLHDEIEAGYRDANVTGVWIEYYDILSEFLAVAKTVNEAAYASYCASASCHALDSFGNTTNQEFSFIHAAREALK